MTAAPQAEHAPPLAGTSREQTGHRWVTADPSTGRGPDECASLPPARPGRTASSPRSRVGRRGLQLASPVLHALRNPTEELEQRLRRFIAWCTQIVIDRRVVLSLGGMDSRGDLRFAQGPEQPLRLAGG